MFHFRLSRGAACGPPFGMGWDVESSGAGDGLPLGLWFLLGLGVGNWPVGGEYSTVVHMKSRGSCHFWGGRARRIDNAGPPPLDPSTGLRVSGPSQGNHEGLPLRGRGSWLGGGCVFRRDGFRLSAAGMTDGGVGSGHGGGGGSTLRHLLLPRNVLIQYQAHVIHCKVNHLVY